MICQDCFAGGPLYYADRTNDRYMCRPCWAALGSDVAMKDQTTIDLAAPRAAATAAQQQADALGMLLAVRVTTDAEAQGAVDMTRSLREQRRALETERDAQVKPLNAVVKRIRDFFRPPIDALERIETHLKAEVKRYRDVQAAAQAAALQAATSHEEIAEAVAVLAPKPDGVVERAVWRWELEDLAQVPREYFVLDEARIGREVRASKGATAIPGIRVVRDSQVIVR